MYDRSKCYCGNKFLSIKIPEFNYSCYLHDRDYNDIYQNYVKTKHNYYLNRAKFFADKAFKERNIYIAKSYKGIKKFKLLFIANLFYICVRLLKDSYIYKK